ncbi:MAG: suppressor of fused domain protein [Chloroflexi bacterium]|uniref:Suppressor of fused domain protein n=1 Tax=Candidatus Chlorohelix allophototropha TaxID=3003348 RepID=A0A8T7M2V7_9CHLR|nr:suppressor of fused domain protein [Chloroflexota bacterium]WJW67497.1 suppressor of fused domain protein [Chloroflexota bacterium L227-S17]
MSFGECYYDHYINYLKDPIRRSIIFINDNSPKIQILMFEHVFRDCIIFCTLGLTHYFKEKFEIFLPVEGDEKEVLLVFSSILDFIVERNVVIERGIYFRNIAKLFPAFVYKYHKTAIYFTTPFGIPSSFDIVKCGERQGKIYQAIFISEIECEYLEKNGVEELETLLEQKEIDIYQLSRESCI